MLNLIQQEWEHDLRPCLVQLLVNTEIRPKSLIYFLQFGDIITHSNCTECANFFPFLRKAITVFEKNKTKKGGINRANVETRLVLDESITVLRISLMNHLVAN